MKFPFLPECKNMCDDDWGVVWAIEKSVLCAAAAAALCVVIRLLFLYLFRRDRAWFHNRVLLNISSYYTVRCCMTYEYAFVYIGHVLLLLLLLLLCTVLLYCCCYSFCCLLLMFDNVCRMAKTFAVVRCIWLHCILSLHSNTIYLSTPWQYCVPLTASICYLLSTTYNIIHSR